MAIRSLRAAALALAAATLLPAAARAQTQQRAWSYCFTSGILSCARFDLTTTALTTQGVRDGTFLDLTVRVDEGAAAAAGLVAFAFDYYSPGGPPVYAAETGFDPSTGWSMTPEAVGGAPVPPVDFRWAGFGQSSTASPFGSGFWMQNTEYDATLPGFGVGTQFIGGCGLGPFGEIDDAYRTPLSTCATGSAYRFQLGTRASLDADLFRAVSATFHARMPGATAGTTVGCVAYTDGAPSVGNDGTVDENGQPVTADLCRVTPAGAVPSTVPEPATGALMALGGGLLAVTARARRRR